MTERQTTSVHLSAASRQQFLRIPDREIIKIARAMAAGRERLSGDPRITS
jgi:hypothetical protein